MNALIRRWEVAQGRLTRAVGEARVMVWLLVLLGVAIEGQAQAVDPVDRSTFKPERLAGWNFQTDSLTNDAGCPPTVKSAPRARTRQGHSVTFSAKAGRSAELRYPTVWTSNGRSRTNFNFSNGTIRFTYSPDWYHGDREDRPGDWCRLVECGGWAVSVDPSGRKVVFQSPATDGSVVTNVVADFPAYPIGTDVLVAWEIAVSYTPSRAWVQIGETFAGYSNTGVQAIPSTAIRERGVSIGSGAGGTYPAQGQIRDLETFSGATDSKPFSDSHFARLRDPGTRRVHWLGSKETPEGIQLTWERGWEGDSRTNATLYGISRRELGSTTWTQVVDDVQERTWTDTSAVPGVYYEYRIGRNPAVAASAVPTLVAARRGAVVDSRGRAILVVDETVAGPLARELADFRRDLRADGWTVVSTNVPRHADLSYPFPNAADYINRSIPLNAIRTQRIKAFIKSQYQQDPGMAQVVYLIGHVPIPYSGFENNVDGHAEHVGAFPADSWYGDMTGLYTDRTTRDAPNVINRNIAGDGRLDQDYLPAEPDGSPGRLEVGVGRIDFSYMEALANGASLEATEVRLLRKYFEKVARWRRGQLPAEDRFRAWTTTDARFFQLIPSVQRLQSRLWGTSELESDQFLEDVFQAPKPTLWGVHGDFGGFDSIGLGGRNFHSSKTAAQGGQGAWPQAMFTTYFGSYFGEWFHWKDDLMRTFLAAPDSVLTATWLNVWQGTVWRTDRFHLGAPYAVVLQDTFAANRGTSSRTTAILGDPFLREHPLPPVGSLSISAKGGELTLTWPAQPAARDGFRIYRRDAGNKDEKLDWVAVAEVPAGSTRWKDVTSRGESSYMIKALALQTTGSGSYTNSSLGTMTPNSARRSTR